MSPSHDGFSAMAMAPSTTLADSAANLASPTAALDAVVPRSRMAGSSSLMASMRSLVPCVVSSKLLRNPAPNDSLSSSKPTASRSSCPWYVLAAVSACPENVRDSSSVMRRISPVASVALSSPAPSLPRLVVDPSNPLERLATTLSSARPVPALTSMASFIMSVANATSFVETSRRDIAGRSSESATPVCR